MLEILLSDNDLVFYLDRNMSLIEIYYKDVCIYTHTFLSNFDNISVYKGHSGTYTYYNIGLYLNSYGYNIVLVPLGNGYLRKVYEDNCCFDKNNTKLRITTTKGSLNVRRVSK